MKEPITMLNINDRAGAVSPKVLPPMAPCCKVVIQLQIELRAEALRKQGYSHEANQLTDALLRVCLPGPHHKS